MNPDQVPSNLKCELSIIRAKHLELDPSAHFFVRCYISIGNGRRILINTGEIPSKGDPNWNELASLEHQGTMESVEGLLDSDGVTFELRKRKLPLILGKFTRSKLLGRAEVAWKDVLGSANMSTEKWIPVSTGGGRGRHPVSPKLPTLLVGLRVKFSQMMGMGKMRASRPRKWEECSCQHCGCSNFGDEDMFAAAAAIEAW